ncbi:hypothetical protein CYMTET_22873, partial [Cymbomonas tetramitiformis]
MDRIGEHVDAHTRSEVTAAEKVERSLEVSRDGDGVELPSGLKSFLGSARKRWVNVLHKVQEQGDHASSIPADVPFHANPLLESPRPLDTVAAPLLPEGPTHYSLPVLRLNGFIFPFHQEGDEALLGFELQSWTAHRLHHVKACAHNAKRKIYSGVGVHCVPVSVEQSPWDVPFGTSYKPEVYSSPKPRLRSDPADIEYK